MQYRNRNGENSTGRNFNHRESTGRHERKDPVGDPFSPDTGGSNSGWSTGTGRVSASDIFPQSHSRPFCTGNFFRGEDGSGTGDGIFAGEYDPGQLRTADPGGISGCYAVHGICASYGAKGGQYVHVGGQRCDDRLHLFRHHGTGGDVCGGRGHREPPQLVQRKLFRNDLGQCESDERRGGGGFFVGDSFGQAAGSLPAGRNLCAESWSEYQDPADPSGGVVQRAFGMYRGICRTDLFCGDRCAAADP